MRLATCSRDLHPPSPGMCSEPLSSLDAVSGGRCGRILEEPGGLVDRTWKDRDRERYLDDDEGGPRAAKLHPGASRRELLQTRVHALARRLERGKDSDEHRGKHREGTPT